MRNNRSLRSESRSLRSGQRLGSLRLGSLRLGSLRLGSLRLGSLRLGSSVIPTPASLASSVANRPLALPLRGSSAPGLARSSGAKAAFSSLVPKLEAPPPAAKRTTSGPIASSHSSTRTRSLAAPA